MNEKFRMVIMVVTVLLCLGCIGGMIWGIYLANMLMTLSCGLIAGFLGLFVYNDYMRMKNEKSL